MKQQKTVESRVLERVCVLEKWCCVDEAFQKKLAKIYDNKIQLNPVVFDKENLMEAGIYQLNNFLIKCKELLKKVCEDIKNDNLESEKFYKKYFE